MNRRIDVMAKRIMIQGTMSNAGKSLLVAGLCRIFAQDGYRVAPFKSQNMALNSYITRDGLEIGRAQAMQAFACGIEPTVDMNPILLKPTSDVGSQIILRGEVLTNMPAKEYFAYKKNLIPQILESFHKLEEEYDVIVIEGAGSPAEINLKENDIVNMGLAKLVDAPVLLVGDIDRGGVFAQLYGTVALLEEEERALIKGLIINKFRGDKTILDPGIRMLEERVNIPVVGVTKYIDVDIEDEDSLSRRLEVQRGDGPIDIAVIRFPHISNFTDFLVLENQPGISLRYVTKAAELGTPDLCILPGTKNTLADLRYFRESGMEAAMLRAKEKGTLIFGICGGYQMLGEELIDAAGVEEGGRMRGIGLLPMRTVFTGQKTRTRVTGSVGRLSGVWQDLTDRTVEGYEIHMGRSEWTGETQPFLHLTEEQTCETKADGAWSDDVIGTYVHGIFDDVSFRQGLFAVLAARKGMDVSQFTTANMQSLRDYRNTQYDLLADMMREYVDIEKIYQIMEGQS